MAEERTIRVRGHGEVEVAPDRARITVGVETTHVDAVEAVERNSAAVQSVLEAVRGLGVADEDVRSAGFHIHHEMHPSPRYRVNNQVVILVRDVTRAGQILSAAVRAGANIAGGISFELSDSSEAEAEALRRAVEDARTRAETLTGSLGVVLGPVVSLDSARGNEFPQPMFARVTRSIAAPVDVPVAAGVITIPADVVVVYNLE
jgi:uncharacterized protein YggE